MFLLNYVYIGTLLERCKFTIQNVPIKFIKGEYYGNKKSDLQYKMFLLNYIKKKVN